MTQRSRLPWRRKAGYAVGDFGLNLFFTFCSLFLLYYYTDVLGLTPGVAGMIIMAALVLEGVFDPLMGVIANRTRTRFGRYRPYLLYGTLPLCLSFISMFVPTGLTGNALAAYALASHLFFRTVYTVVGIPFIALSAEMTNDSRERSEIAGARMLFSLACGMILATMTLPLSAWLGGGQMGFFWLSLAYSALAFLILMICFSQTSEGTTAPPDAPSIREMIAMLRANRPLQVLLLATVLASIGSTMASKTLLYYLKYDVGSEAALTPALTIITASAAVSIPFWIVVTALKSKRVAWLSAVTLTVCNSLVFFMVAPRLGPALWAILGVSGFANGAVYLTFWSMIPDTVEYGEWKTGARAEGAIYGLVSLTQKMALGLGIGLLGVLLDGVGYRPNLVQTKETLNNMRVMLTLAPAAMASMVGALIWFYPLDHKLHGRLTRAIDWRRNSAVKASAPKRS